MTAESTQSTNAEFAAFHKRLAGLEDLLSGHIQQCKDQTKFTDSHKEESSRHTKDRDEKTKELKETLTTVSRLVEEARDEHGNQKVLRKGDIEAVLQEMHAMHEVQMKTLRSIRDGKFPILTERTAAGHTLSVLLSQSLFRDQIETGRHSKSSGPPCISDSTSAVHTAKASKSDDRESYGVISVWKRKVQNLSSKRGRMEILASYITTGGL
ncbi:hypothetical protein EV421DRAFT_1737627 [Armillaria borealis]|uniref:Uncharacterized protein n=1 Tax=Armillaria borealis TaxID=47425 RepID=A0AA39MML1_9AGAR|nr:hypothetical protein EV421DRAFT_1737627 [Armillaria borealis]